MDTRSKENAKRSWHERFDPRRVSHSAGAFRPSGAAEELKVETRVSAQSDTTEIMLFDEIGSWGVTAKRFIEILNFVKTEKITLRINSPGGDVFDGYAIYNALSAHPAKVHVIIEGIAASAASVIALAGDTVEAGDPSMVMIHCASTCTCGNSQDLLAESDVLAKIDDQLASVYSSKCGKPKGEMLALMRAETWMTGQEAVEMGLCDTCGAVVPEKIEIVPPSSDDIEKLMSNTAAKVSEWINTEARSTADSREDDAKDQSKAGIASELRKRRLSIAERI
ncbi:ClpP Protease subunit of ATP-dependent Clp proteases [uncultured Caudovirales phage]|uniref:ClpP Protease subunit of ATP-dependent Clp proteases n=1 Tax=uncultured Caudovirales phage TaxID=2100421 RepID=A0A6J5RPL2_9CAUD|nr:ClpP Protease subunit of ATP-dependent Clp proteases [uncultured Caudovirales phage]